MPEPNNEVVCHRCNLGQPATHMFCARCGSPLSPQANPFELVEAKFADEPKPNQQGKFAYGLGTLIAAVTLISICLALFAASPGLGIAAGVVSLPAIIRTLLVIQRKRSRGQPVSESNKIYLFLASFGTSTVITLVTVLASAGVFLGLTFMLLFATIFSICLGGVSKPAQPVTDPQQAMWGIVLVSIAVAALVLWGFSYWVRDRWRRDTKG